MSAGPRFFVHPHREGPWLVVRGRRRLAVPPELGRRLLDLDGGRPGVPELASRLDGDETAARALLHGGGAVRRRRRGPWLRLPLVPAAAVRRAARALAPLTGGGTLALLGLGGGWLVALSGLRPGDATPVGVGGWLAALGVFVAGGLVHELGHAAALARGGYPPGGVGAGLQGVLPVLWCDVSAIVLLARADRVRVDLAGPVFQVAAAGLMGGAGRLLPGAAGTTAALAAVWSLLAVAWSLTPVFRADGFWLLTDLAGLDDLDRTPAPGDGRHAVILISAYALARSAFFGSVATAALGRAGPADVGGVAALAVGLLLGALAVLRLVRLVAGLARLSGAGASGPPPPKVPDSPRPAA